MKSISVFFPCYNDEKSIGFLVNEAINVLINLTNNYEIIVVDDGSQDQSREVLNKLSKKYNCLKLVFHKRNRGYGGALKSGFKNASKELVFYTDGDGQYDVKELPLLLALMTEDVNFVNGIKMSRQDPTYRIFLGNFYNFVVRWLFWLPVYDVDCDFRLVRNSLLKKIDLKSNSGSICLELVKKVQRAGGKFRQVSVHHYERRFGQSQFFRIDRLWKTFCEVSNLWFELMISNKFFNGKEK